MIEDQVRPAVAGDEAMLPRRAVVVHSSCGVNQGNWYCCTHEAMFENNLMKDFHITTGEHKLAWWCWEHGLEAP